MGTPVIGGSGSPSENAAGNSSAQSLAQQVLQLGNPNQDYAYDPFYGTTRTNSWVGLGGGAQVVPRAHLANETMGWGQEDKTLTGSQHMAIFFKNWNTDAKWRTQLVTLGLATGLLGKGWTTADAQKAWDTAGQISAQNLRTGAMKLTPMQTLQWYAGNAGKGLGNLGGLGGTPTTSTSVHSTYQIEDPATAMAITQSVLQAALGRQATPDEVARYKNAIQAYDRAHPQVTTTTSNNVTGNSTSSTTGGVTQAGESAILQNTTNNSAEGQAYQTNGVFDQAMKILAGL